MKTIPRDAAQQAIPPLSHTFRRRMGGTTYEVCVRFKEQAESMEDKVLRMIRNDESNGVVKYPAIGEVNQANHSSRENTNTVGSKPTDARYETPETPEKEEKPCLQNEPVCGMMVVPQMSRSA